MSKGTGRIQRDILARCLDDPRTEVQKGVYDLRLVARCVAGPGDAKYHSGDPKFALPFCPSESFSAAFSRAVRSLIKRGELERVDRIHRGKLSRQIRFVRLRSKAVRN
jgi:hypothetical protein